MSQAPAQRPGFSSLETVQFTQGGTAAQARACVKIDNQLYHLKSFRLSKNAHGATNTGSFVLAYAGNPDWTNQLFRGTDPAGGPVNNSPVYCEVWAGFPPNPGPNPSISGLMRRFYGVVDKYDPEDMNQTTFYLRSIAAPLTSDRITSAIQNKTTIEVIRELCAPYNIPVIIDPELTNPFTLARVYAQDFMVGLKNIVKWDVLLRSSV